jgi:hypothetical protein
MVGETKSNEKATPVGGREAASQLADTFHLNKKNGSGEAKKKRYGPPKPPLDAAGSRDSLAAPKPASFFSSSSSPFSRYM